jgi:murein DD-endopeptidase MepM/ murein hydrolase activator NlpD
MLPHLRRNGPIVATLLVALASALFALAPNAALAKTVTHYLADGFDYPVGPPDASGYYKARGFWPNGHLGEDWNGRAGGNSDEGDPVYSIAHGVVVYSDDFRAGWGNVIIIRHAYREKNGRVYFIDSLYGHLQRRIVRNGDKVTRGEKIGTIGRGPHNMYYAHLHLEIRKNLALGMQRSKFKQDYSNYHSPTHFIAANRRLRQEFRQYRIPVDTFGTGGTSTDFTQNSITIPQTGRGDMSRPNVPAPVRDVIDKHGATENPGPLKKFWTGLKKTLGF